MEQYRIFIYLSRQYKCMYEENIFKENLRMTRTSVSHKCGIQTDLYLHIACDKCMINLNFIAVQLE